MNEVITSVTFCGSNVERCARVVVSLLHVHNRKGKPKRGKQRNGGEERRTHMERLT